MDLSLNADAALRVYLPPESWNGDAQHRFIFRTEDGEEEPLLARLAVVQPDVNNRRFEHCVLLRPETAETARIFVCQGDWPRGSPWMTPHAARLFRWWLFEHNLRGNGHRCNISRFWLKREEKRDILLRVDGGGWGETSLFEDVETAHRIYPERFAWRRDYHEMSCDDLELQFLRQTDIDFNNQLQSACNDSEGDISIALKWQHFDEAERDAYAYRYSGPPSSPRPSAISLERGIQMGFDR